MQTLNDLLPWFFHYGYITLFLIMIVGELYLPVPSNLALLAAGALSHISQGGVHFNIFLAAGVAFVGCMIGDLVAYYIARKFGHEKRRARVEKKYKSFKKVSKYLHSHPVITISASRLIGFLSPVVNSLAGFSKVSWATFIGADILGNVVYVALYMGVGYVIEGASGSLVDLLAIVSAILGILIVSYVGVMVFLRD